MKSFSTSPNHTQAMKDQNTHAKTMKDLEKKHGLKLNQFGGAYKVKESVDLNEVKTQSMADKPDHLFKKDKLFIYLLIFFIIILFITFFGAKAEQVQGRYALIPGILLIFITYRVSQISNGILKFLSSFLIVICLLSGFYEYKSRNIYPQFLICMNCPNWKNEVSTWSEDNSYLLKIWQYPTKKMSLKK